MKVGQVLTSGTLQANGPAAVVTDCGKLVMCAVQNRGFAADGVLTAVQAIGITGPPPLKPWAAVNENVFPLVVLVVGYKKALIT